MKKKIMNKIEAGCEAVSDFMYEHGDAATAGYMVFCAGVCVASLVLYGARTKAIVKGAQLRKRELFM